MRKEFSVFLFFFFVVIFNLTAQETEQPVIETGKICFIRSTGFQGSAQAFKTFIDEQFVCKLNNKRYSYHEVAPGIHTCSVQFGGKKSKEKAEKFEVDVKPGETTYVQLVFETGILINNVYCEEITENTALQKISTLKEDEKCL